MFDWFSRSILCALFILTAMPSMAETLSSLSLTELEQRLTEIDTQLQNLAHYTPRGGFGRVGYRSAEYDAPDHRTSLQIDLLAERHVDLLVLVPTIIRDPVKGFRPDGFPLALRILDENGSLLAEQNFSGQHRQRIAPFTIPLEGKSISKLTVEATKLSPRAFDGKFVFQLAEFLVFDGSENVALERTAKPSTFPADAVDAWAPAFVTDGSLPYLMNSARGLPSTAYLSPRRDPSITKPLSLSIDLKESYPLTQLYLHAVDQSDTIPQSAPDGIGMPHHLLVEGANQSDFSDARTLLEIHCTSVFESDPILMRRLGGEHVRYVRLTAVDPYLFPFYDGLHPRIGFSEIEIFQRAKMSPRVRSLWCRVSSETIGVPHRPSPTNAISLEKYYPPGNGWKNSRYGMRSKPSDHSLPPSWPHAMPAKNKPSAA